MQQFLARNLTSNLVSNSVLSAGSSDSRCSRGRSSGLSTAWAVA